MPFRGWPVEAVEFYEGLIADNSKGYWQEHREVYDTCVDAPMRELLASLSGEFGTGRIFRPYRDLRFSPDKTPYKTHIGATLGDGPGSGGYVQFSADGLAAGFGMFHLAADQLDRYRKAVDEAGGGRLTMITRALEKQGIALAGHDTLVRVPRGYPADHPRADLLRRKGLVAWRQWPVGAWLGTARARSRVVEFLRAAGPLGEWLDRHVGPTRLEPTGRR